MKLNTTEWTLLGASALVCAGALLALAMKPGLRANKRGGPRANRLRRWGEK